MGFNQKLYEQMNEYEEYILSKDWALLKEIRLKKDNNQCVLCKSKEKLVCHHITYIRLYHEDINDMIILCSRCHSRMHRLSPPKDQPDFAKQKVWNQVIKPTQVEMDAFFEMMAKKNS